MIGLLVLGGAAAYVGIFWFVISKARNRGERISAVVIAFLIPFWDLPIGLINYYQHCKNESGNRIEKGFAVPDSILFYDTSYKPREMMKLGFQVVEYATRDKVTRYTKDGEGMLESFHKSPISQISYRYGGWTPLSWNLDRSDYVVVRASDGKTVARQSDFSWRGTWWEALSRIRLVSLSRCAGATDEPLLETLARSR